ncbi:G-type lectin S-receptor-like serine/threonine-protein kinase At4g03230 isoform X2 [Carex rostrata]
MFFSFTFPFFRCVIPSVPYSKFSSRRKSRPRHLIIIISVSVSLLIIGCFLSFLLIRKLRYKEPNISQEEKMLATNNKILMDQWIRERSSDFPLFDFNQIENATGQFSLDNKLGEGGFRPVYKGVLQDGLEIAVKRLSSYSGQGLVEFKNEIQLIAKLQRRNLVRLVGWCIQGEEKILIYEFMPNKSLDYFILDKRRGSLLNWERRFEIIKGIAQGLLYLHQYSRLRIVHRDLKASNILLDSEMNPKISDFGLARIFGPKELQANTNRVVGTYGYMAPEYASEGLFSIKSDVFSFGVLLLEIVSSKRNTGFHQDGEFLNLLGYAWYKWKGGNIPELICPTLTEVPQRQPERCIHVGLLCVQENPTDRPIMSDVIVFLTTESIILPEPKQPAYFNMRVKEEAVDPSNFNGSACSINYVTLTNPEVR